MTCKQGHTMQPCTDVLGNTTSNSAGRRMFRCVPCMEWRSEGIAQNAVRPFSEPDPRQSTQKAFEGRSEPQTKPQREISVQTKQQKSNVGSKKQKSPQKKRDDSGLFG